MNDARTGGYDVCVELSESVLSATADAFSKGKELSYELSDLPLGGDGLSGRLVLEIRGAAMAVGSRGDHVFLTLSFSDGGLTLTSSPEGRAAPLAGSLTIAMTPRGRVDSSGASVTTELVWDEDAPLTVDLDAESDAALSRLLGEANHREVFVDLLSDALRRPDGSPDQLVGLFARLVTSPSEDGSLDPLTLVEHRLRLLPAKSGRPGVLCLLGNVRRSSAGSASRKTEIATDRDHTGSITLSEDAFHDLVHCPALASSFHVAKSALPKDCGEAESLHTGSLDIKELLLSLEEGHGTIQGKLDTGGTGYTAHVDFTVRETLTVSPSGDLQAKLTLDGDPKIDISLDWWVTLLGGFVLEAIGADFVEPIVKEIIEVVLSSALSGGIADTISRAFRTLGGAVQGSAITPDQVVVRPGSVALLGKAPPPPDVFVPKPVLRLTARVADETAIEVGRGVESGVTCQETDDGKPKSYPYVDVRVTQVATFTTEAIRLGEPLTYAWKIAGEDVRATHGTLAISVPVTDAFGRRTGSRTAHVDYQIHDGGASMTASNYPSEDYVPIGVECRARNASGDAATGTAAVAFDGMQRRYMGDYASDLRRCVDALLAAAKQAARDGVMMPLPRAPEPLGGGGRPAVIDPIEARKLVSRAALSRIAARAGLDASFLTRSMGAAARAGALERIR